MTAAKFYLIYIPLTYRENPAVLRTVEYYSELIRKILGTTENALILITGSEDEHEEYEMLGLHREVIKKDIGVRF